VTLGLGTGGGGSFRFTGDLYGETFSATSPPNYTITRNVVPCEYELRIQVTEAIGTFSVLFGFPPGTRAPDTGGAQPSTITILEGPNHRVGQILGGGGTVQGCIHEFLGGNTQLPATIRLRFRVEAGLRDGVRCGS